MKNLHPVARTLVILAAALGLLNLVLGTVDRTAGGSRSGPTSSAYTTAPTGLAAFEELLRRDGRSVAKIRKPLTETALEANSTMFVMDGFVSPEEASELSRFVAAGGRLIAAGASVHDWMDEVVPTSAEWSPRAVGDARPVAPTDTPVADMAASVSRVTSPGRGSWTSAGSAATVLRGAQSDLLLIATHGRGSIGLMSSASPLWNRHLDEADNAALGLTLAGPGRPTSFLETVHGYVDGRGIGALPSRARWLTAFLFVALCIWLAVRGRRLGPTELADRELAPARRLYVEALASSLRRSGKRTEGAMGVQHAARQRLLVRSGLPRDASAEAIRHVGPRFGLTGAEVDAILTPARSDDDLLAVGRALSKLETRIR